MIGGGTVRQDGVPFAVRILRGERTAKTGGTFRADIIMDRDPIGALCALQPWNEGGAPAGWQYGEATDLADTLRRVRGAVAPSGAAESMARALDLLRPAIKGMRGLHGAALRRRTYDTDGDEVDAERWRAGFAECWTRSKRRAAPIGVRIGIGLSMTGGNGPETFARVSGLAAAATEALRSAGLGVEIWGVMASDLKALGQRAFGIPEREAAIVVPLSTPERTLNGRQLAALGYPGLQRAAGFRYRSLAWDTKDPGWSQTIEPTEALTRALKLDAFIGHTWTEGKPNSQRDRIVGFIERMLKERTAAA